MNDRGMFQVAAFKAFFKSSPGTMEDRFARAIVITSDENFRSIRFTNPDVVDDFIQGRSRTKRERKVGSQAPAASERGG